MIFGSDKYVYDLVTDWAKHPDGHFGFVSGLSVDAQDRLYVFDRTGKRPVTVFDRAGNYVGSWGTGLFKNAHGIYAAPDAAVYCTDNGNHTVSKFTADGKLLMTLGNKDRPSDTGFVDQPDARAAARTIKRSGPPFNKPTNVALSFSGEIYVSDGYGNARIHKFSAGGKLLLSWGEPGSGPGQFMIPHRAWVDRDQLVWVTDRENSRMQIFTPDGKYVREWPAYRPTDIYIDADRAVYLGEGKPNLGVGIYTIDGKVLARVAVKAEDEATSPLFSPHALAVDSRGDIYIGGFPPQKPGAADRGPGLVLKFVRK